MSGERQFERGEKKEREGEREKKTQAFALAGLNKRLIIGRNYNENGGGTRRRKSRVLLRFIRYVWQNVKRNRRGIRLIILRNALLPFWLPQEVPRIYQLKVSNCIYGLSLSRFVPPSHFIYLSSSFTRFLCISTNSISFLCTSRFFATSLHVASVWVTTDAT